MWKKLNVVWKIIILLVIIAGLLYVLRSRFIDTSTPFDFNSTEPAVIYPDLSAETYVIEVDDHPVHGAILIDADGNTLYTYAGDLQNESLCIGACAETWPPMIVAIESIAAPVGVVDMLTTVARSDGSLHAVYDGQPLYYYSGDEAPGDAFGHGLDDMWSVVSTTDPYGVE